MCSEDFGAIHRDRGWTGDHGTRALIRPSSPSSSSECAHPVFLGFFGRGILSRAQRSLQNLGERCDDIPSRFKFRNPLAKPGWRDPPWPDRASTSNMRGSRTLWNRNLLMRTRLTEPPSMPSLTGGESYWPENPIGSTTPRHDGSKNSVKRHLRSACGAVPYRLHTGCRSIRPFYLQPYGAKDLVGT